MNITDIGGTTKLNNGVEMPYLGLGVYQSADGDEVIKAIHYAFDAGYRLIDTAAIYNNERGVGQAIKESDLKREEIFLTSKVWNSDQGFDKTLKAFDISLNKLGTGYLDLYLIHWPVKGKFKESWKALRYLYDQGVVRSIGVSNFMKRHLDILIYESEVVPMVNQIEFHPLLIQQELIDYCKQQNIQCQAWSPIMRGQVAQYNVINRIAEKYNKSPIQVTLRWDLQNGVSTIPKSVRKERIVSNASIFDFELTTEEISQINQLDMDMRTGPDPDNFNF